MDNELDKILNRLKLEFIDGAKDRLDDIDNAIDLIYRGEGNRGDLFVDLQRNIHSLKGAAGSYGLGFASILAHRLEDYLESSKRLEQDEWLNVQKFVDQIRAVIESGDEPPAARQDEVLASLPSNAQPGADGTNANELTALIIMPPGVQRKAVSNRLTDHGIGVSFADDPVQSIGISFSLKPDVILSNQEFTLISGFELANMLAATQVTGKIPFALMTSHDDLSSSTTHAGSTIGVIKKDSAFLDNISNYLRGVSLLAPN